MFILFLNLYIIKYKNFYSSLSCCNLKVGVFLGGGGGGCYLKFEKKYFFECVGLRFRVICEYMFGNAMFHFYSHSFCLDAIMIFIFFKLVILVIHIGREFISWASTLIYN
jgi:hypothetical protein